MSILFVLLMFLLIMSISYFRSREEVPAEQQVWAGPRAPRIEREYGFAIPQGYSFHPGHTWVLHEGAENTRVGLDSFAANLLSPVEQLDVIGPNRWIRQGQKLVTLKSGEMVVDMLSPVEGVITAINQDVIADPALTTRDPYKDGWIAVIKSPDFATNQKNLVSGAMVAPWMQNNVTRLSSMAGSASPLAQDGGLPVTGLLARLQPEVRRQVVKEFFLS